MSILVTLYLVHMIYLVYMILVTLYLVPTYKLRSRMKNKPSNNMVTNLCTLTYEEQAIQYAILPHPSLTLLAIDSTMKPELLTMENTSHQLLKCTSSLQQGIVYLVLLEIWGGVTGRSMSCVCKIEYPLSFAPAISISSLPYTATG